MNDHLSLLMCNVVFFSQDDNKVPFLALTEVSRMNMCDWVWDVSMPTNIGMHLSEPHKGTSFPDFVIFSVSKKTP